jgi:allantoin racemase
MRRRAFVTGMAGAMMWPLAAHAQQTRIVINPNSSQATTDMMVRIAQSAASDGVEIIGATATKSPRMIAEPAALTASAAEVVEIGMRLAGSVAGIIVSAFGDPGMRDLQARVGVPVVGIAQSSMLEAASGDRRLGSRPRHLSLSPRSTHAPPTSDWRASTPGSGSRQATPSSSPDAPMT